MDNVIYPLNDWGLVASQAMPWWSCCHTTLLKSNDFLIFSPQSDAGWEEFYDYIFPDDEANMPNFKLLQMARLWKKQNEQQHSMWSSRTAP